MRRAVNPVRDGEALFAAAQNLVGTRFRLHGRDPATGLDCIGLVVAAYDRVHLPLGRIPDDYPLRGRSLDDFRAGFERLGLAERWGAPQTADIALIHCGHGQYHLALLGPESHVHAHAGLRRVVETPGVPEGVVGIYCLANIVFFQNSSPVRGGGPLGVSRVVEGLR